MKGESGESGGSLGAKLIGKDGGAGEFGGKTTEKILKRGKIYTLSFQGEKEEGTARERETGKYSGEEIGNDLRREN